MSEATTRAYQLKSDPSVIVQATQFDPHEYPWQEGIMPWSTAKYRPRDMSWGYIDTPSKREHVWNGDYIALDRLGKPYPVRPKLFEDTYRPVIVINTNPDDDPAVPGPGYHEEELKQLVRDWRDFLRHTALSTVIDKDKSGKLWNWSVEWIEQHLDLEKRSRRLLNEK